MKKTIVFMTLAMVAFFSTNSQALTIDFGESTIGQTIKVPELADTTNLDTKTVPVYMGSVYNESDETVWFQMTSIGVGYGFIYATISGDFFDFGLIELSPKEKILGSFIEVAGAVYGPDQELVPALVGTKGYIYGFEFSYTLNGQEYSVGYPLASNPLDFLWEIEVVGNNSGGGGTSPVPEPTTMLLFGAGLACLAATGRRKKK